MRISLVLAVLAALQLAAGLAGQMIVLRLIGIGEVTDAYVAAQALPLFLTAVLGSSLQNVWLPRLSVAAPASLGSDDTLAIAQGQACKLLLVLIVPLWATASIWARLLFPGFSQPQVELVGHMTGPLFLATALNVMSSLLTAGLRARGQFFSAESTSLVGSMAAIAAIVVMLPAHGITAVTWIAAVRSFLVYVAQMHLSGWPRFRFKETAGSREAWRLLQPLAGGTSLIKTGPLADRYLSSMAGSGGVTALNLAQLGVNSIATILERALITPFLPALSRQVVERDIDGLRRGYRRVLLRTAIAMTCLALVLIALRPLWGHLLHVVLRIPSAQAEQIWWICLVLLPSLYVAVCGSAAVGVFYALGEALAPMTIGLLGFTIGLGAKILLFAKFGVLGIAAGSSIYLMINMAAYHWAVIRRVARLESDASLSHRDNKHV